MTLQQFFAEHTRVALGFSGGVDSCYLLSAAVSCGADVQPYFVKTAFQPDFELRDARIIAKQLGVELRIIELDILGDAEVASNQASRCYHCKKRIFAAITAAAKRDGYTVILDGSNASDQADDRPGMQALSELSVYSPLRLCGIHKDAVRAGAKAAGLFTWDKPAYACLATRVPTNTPITKPMLHAIEQAESALATLGFVDFRVRLLPQYSAAKLELTEAQLVKALLLRREILDALTNYFSSITIDLLPRTPEEAGGHYG